ncbi:hypothetical protein RDWZM_003818 [Blomia tropicalis]|uniref:Uncharacterized protein n=1 Tax=Blomia tropicalis TaxID=40697 RepID=A0A9Q0MFY3_BLOTA|nr:hypothetical protein BLOT_002520 [Blomia tropicalis]KAJ6225273.1 hypothetical protein RDWZM_003818 [Blomia tropicalis]
MISSISIRNIILIITVVFIYQSSDVSAQDKNVQQQSKKCQQYGHSCLGGHGKRSSSISQSSQSQPSPLSMNSYSTYFDALKSRQMPASMMMMGNHADSSHSFEENGLIDPKLIRPITPLGLLRWSLMFTLHSLPPSNKKMSSMDDTVRTNDDPILTHYGLNDGQNVYQPNSRSLLLKRAKEQINQQQQSSSIDGELQTNYNSLMRIRRSIDNKRPSQQQQPRPTVKPTVTSNQINRTQKILNN